MYITPNCPNIPLAVLNAIAQGEKEIIFEKATYHFYPDRGIERISHVSNHDNDGPKKVGLQIEHASDITIDGGGSRFIFHGIMLPAAVEYASNVKLCNFSIDVPVTAYVHSTVLDADEHHCDIKLWDNTPYHMEGNIPMFEIDGGCAFPYKNVLEFNAELECIEYGTNDRDYFTHSEAEELEPGVLRICQDFSVVPKKGNYMLWHLGKRFAPGIFINESRQVTVENVQIHHCFGMGVLAELTRDITIRQLYITPSEGRFNSAYADGVHFVECSGSILLEDSRIEKQMDDPLNCHGIYAQVEEICGNTVWVRLKHHQALGMPIFKAGDRVEYIEYDTLLSYGENELVEAELCNESQLRLVFKQEPGVRKDDYLENISHTPNLTVRNCYFGKNRARGLLITTRGKVLVEGNTFERAGAAIRISGDCNFWYESGCVRDVTIRNNTFIDINANPRWGKAVIDVAPQVLRVGGPVHRNIRIVNNTFRTFDIPLLWANCAENVVFEDNVVERTNTFPPKGLSTEEVVLCEIPAL